MARKNGKIKFDVGGFEGIRQDPKVRAELRRRAEAIAEAAGGEAKGFIVRDNKARDSRGGVTVMATGHAARSNAKHRSLIRALSAGR